MNQNYNDKSNSLKKQFKKYPTRPYTESVSSSEFHRTQYTLQECLPSNSSFPNRQPHIDKCDLTYERDSQNTTCSQNYISKNASFQEKRNNASSSSEFSILNVPIQNKQSEKANQDPKYDRSKQNTVFISRIHNSNNLGSSDQQKNIHKCNNFQNTESIVDHPTKKSFNQKKYKAPPGYKHPTSIIKKQSKKEEKFTKTPSNESPSKNYKVNKAAKKNKTVPVKKPLLSFKRILPSSDNELHEDFSDEDNFSLFSFASSYETQWKATASSVYSDESSHEEEIWTRIVSDEDVVENRFNYESDISSSNFIRSSSLEGNNAVPSDNFRNNFFGSNSHLLVSYYWDMESCPVPDESSLYNFIKLVRDIFGAEKSEREFVAMSEKTRLNYTFAKEFNSTSRNKMNVSLMNKNTADAEISSILQEFFRKYNNVENHAIVLISGNYNLLHIVNQLKIKYHIYVELICKKSVNPSLLNIPDRYYFYEDFVKNLSKTNVNENKLHVITLSNFPIGVTEKQIKSHVVEMLKDLHCKIKSLGQEVVEITFTKKILHDEVLLRVKELLLIYDVILITISEKEVASHVSNMSNLFEKNTHKKKSIFSKNQLVAQTNSSLKSESCISVKKATTLCLKASDKIENFNFLRSKLEKYFDNFEFEIKWDDRNIYDHIILISFVSLSKAQKAKKIILENQNKYPNFPRFYMLIKQQNSLTAYNSIKNYQNSQENTIQEYIHVVESKKQVSLKKYEENKLNLKSLSSSTPEIVELKIKELEEQKENFLNYSLLTVDKMRKLVNSVDTVEKDLNCLLQDYKRECTSFQTFLPIYAKKNLILERVKRNQVLVIRAETGSGKSTQLTQYLWREQSLSNNGLVICTQPRKIAAVTLAKHVSSQIGCALGDIVGYHVGMNCKSSSNTGILYVTDITMLKMLVNTDFKNISCLIVDEAHERTVYTDLLLGVIKNQLKLKPELKLIITSATIDASIFVDYFQLKEECILEVSGRTFPVEDIWSDFEVKLGWDYFPKIIETVINILNKEEDGDILVFLTTPFETERAEKILAEKLVKKKKSVRIYQLHGKLEAAEQQKVFEHISVGIRKVVFATNCAETSITIPGIKYVVDSGFVKESQYDAIRNMNVMSINFVSQSSAQQRKGRAGRTQPGKCYHMYSESNFEKMEKNSDPEILRCNLGNAILKLMKIGVKNPLQFEFVQSPPKAVLEHAMKQLISLNAVSEDSLSLTPLGELISCLPVEPRLGHLVFKGIKNDIGFEAVILSSVVTVSQKIFFRTSDNKDEADLKKIRFCASESDFITFYNIYKEWSKIPKHAKNKWCVSNYINARSMRTAQELVNDIIKILNDEVHIKVISKFSDANANNQLLKMIFHSFYQNLCIFSGHSKFGYMSTSISGTLQVHPSSSLMTFGKWRPQYLVYDSILQTNKTYLVNISPVPDEFLSEAHSLNNLPQVLEALKTLPLQMHTFHPIGNKIILNDIIGKGGIKIKNTEKNLKSLIDSDLVAIDVDISKGKIKVFLPQSSSDAVASEISPLISQAQERLLNEEKEAELSSHLYAIISAGALIKDVIIPGEFRDLKVILKDGVDVSSVVEKLQIYGKNFKVIVFKNYIKATYSTPGEAQLVLQKLSNDDSFTLKKLPKAIYHANTTDLYKVHLSFLRRKCTGIAFVTIEPLDGVHEALQFFRLFASCYKLSVLTFSISKKTNDIRIQGLKQGTEQNDLRDFLTSSLKRTDYKISKCAVIREKINESGEVELESTKDKLYNLFVQFTSKEKLSFDINKPQSQQIKWHASVYFQNWHDGEAAVTCLKSRSNISGFADLTMKPTIQTFLYAKLTVFNAVKQQIEDTIQFFQNSSVPGNTLEINIYPKGKYDIQIKILSNNVTDISDSKKAILKYLMGDQIICKGNKTLEKLFSSEGIIFLKTIPSSYSSCFLEVNSHKKIITLFGDDSACNKIKIEINQFLEKLVDEEITEISLIPQKGKPGVLHYLLKDYGHDLKKLKEVCCLSHIEMNIKKYLLCIKGNSSSVSKCQDIVNEIKNNQKDITFDEDTELCPVCMNEVTDPFHRLEYCGHAYCNECLLHLFKNSEDYPIRCLSCSESIVLLDFQWALETLKMSEAVMFKKSYQNFIQNREDIDYCLSPNCSMIFRITKEENKFTCPLCGNSICTSCCELFHHGMSCSMHKSCKKDEDFSLQAWMQADPEKRKLCPKCSSPIEKNGGCNHMICRKCKSDLCWLCLQVFSDGNLVYNHIPFCPKQK